MSAFNNIIEFQKQYDTEEKCRAFLEQQRWNGKPICPFCGSDNVCRFSNGKVFKCRNKPCRKKFSVTVGLIYENTKLPLTKWFYAQYVCLNHKKGISSLQLSRDLHITQRSAWFVLHRIREMVKKDAPQMLKGVVQVDETYVGGKTKNKHQSKRLEILRAGNSLKKKIPVVGLLEKDGKVLAFVVKNTGARTLRGLMYKHVEKKSTVVTDGYKPYKNINKHYTHVVVKGDTGRYVIDNQFHTQNIENFWSIFKRGIVGIYHYMSEKHLQRYCEEFSYRYNTRGITDAERFTEALKHTNGRLKYKTLVAPVKDMSNEGSFYAFLKKVRENGNENPHFPNGLNK